MAELTLTINGKNFNISCDNGQEQRVMDLAHFVDAKLSDISSAGAAQNESHLFVLGALMMADEIFELRDQIYHGGGEPQSSGKQREEELAVAQAIEAIAGRIDGLASKISKAA